VECIEFRSFIIVLQYLFMYRLPVSHPWEYRSMELSSGLQVMYHSRRYTHSGEPYFMIKLFYPIDVCNFF